MIFPFILIPGLKYGLFCVIKYINFSGRWRIFDHLSQLGSFLPYFWISFYECISVKFHAEGPHFAFQLMRTCNWHSRIIATRLETINRHWSTAMQFMRRIHAAVITFSFLVLYISRYFLLSIVYFSNILSVVFMASPT